MCLAVSVQPPGTAPHREMSAVLSKAVTRDSAEAPAPSPSGRAANTQLPSAPASS